MPEKPTTAAGYPPDQVARVKATCLYLFDFQLFNVSFSACPSRSAGSAFQSRFAGSAFQSRSAGSACPSRSAGSAFQHFSFFPKIRAIRDVRQLPPLFQFQLFSFSAFQLFPQHPRSRIWCFY
jgi:hypothetical protein